MLDELYMRDLAKGMMMPEEVLPEGKVTVSAPQAETAPKQPEMGTITGIPQTPFEKVLETSGIKLSELGDMIDQSVPGTLNTLLGRDIPIIGNLKLRDFLPFVGSQDEGKLTGTPAALIAAGTGQPLGGQPVVGSSIGPDGQRYYGTSGSPSMLSEDVGTAVMDVATLGLGKPLAAGAKKAVKATKNMPVGMSIKMIDGSDAVVPKAPQINTPEFGNWFGGSKVVNSAGSPIAVFHGTGRPDRVGEQFKKSRATSGPMSFFTDNPEVASGYAKGKTDTSITYEDDAFDYKNWFKKKVGRENLNLEQVGARMSTQEKQNVIEKLRNIGTDNDGNIVTGQGLVSDSTFNFMLKDSREANGNPLKLANQLWLESGTLYGKEDEFAKVLNLAGVKGFDYNDPHAKFPFVYKVFLSIKNPLDTSNIGEDVIQSLEQASRRVRKPAQKGGADSWDKNTVNPKVWIERLKSDQAEGTTHAWTSIPDWVTKTLKAKGFDGIKDSGGKGGGINHNVWIPFEENQVKSAIGNKGTFDPKSKNIVKGVAIGGGGAGAAATQEENK